MSNRRPVQNTRKFRVIGFIWALLGTLPAPLLAESPQKVPEENPGAPGQVSEVPLDLPGGDSFWKVWGDGQAELSGYELTFPRYGHPRKGTAVTIFVTETFDHDARVKTERSGPGAFPVMKLNLVQDFQTGIYDYNLMTSVFTALAAVDNYPLGSVTKASFSAQEWCGHVYQQALFDPQAVRLQSHSYFEGEADLTTTLPAQSQGLPEDALLLWARGLAGPPIAPGQSQSVPLLRSMQISRLLHVPMAWDQAVLTRDQAIKTLTVPAGTFQVRTCTVTIQRSSGAGVEADKTQFPTVWTFEVEARAPHRLVRWSRDDGLSARLLGTARMAYWKMNGPGFEPALEKLGLTPPTMNVP